MPNPIGVASGTFGFGEEYSSFYDLSLLGAIYTKAVTPTPRPGNPPPRLLETPAGLMNSIGLANPGVDRFLEEKIPFLKKVNCPVFINVAGSSSEEYYTVIERCDDQDEINGYEVNISCPNVKKGGLAFGTDTAMVEKLTSSLRKLTKKPLILKLTPNVTSIGDIAAAAEAGGADAISCINTVRGMVINTKNRRPFFKAGTAGLSGPAIRPIGVACVYQVTRRVTIPVIGLGGIVCADDAIQYLLAGAKAIQVGTANFTNPNAPIEILDGIKTYMKENKIKSINDFAGLLEQ